MLGNQMSSSTEILEEIGSENTEVQPLSACMSQVSQKKNYTEVVFGTTTSMYDISSEKKTALIVWCDTEDYHAALDKLNNQ